MALDQSIGGSLKSGASDAGGGAPCNPSNGGPKVPGVKRWWQLCADRKGNAGNRQSTKRKQQAHPQRTPNTGQFATD
jgi:hypothetical protein